MMTEEEIDADAREQIRLRNLEELKAKIEQLKKKKKIERDSQLRRERMKVPEAKAARTSANSLGNIRREEQRRQSGLCTDCGVRAAPEGYVTCETCRAKRNGRPLPENEEIIVEKSAVEPVQKKQSSKRTNFRIRREAAWIELGLCRYCGKIPVEGKLFCQKCLDTYKEYRMKSKFGLGKTAYKALLKKQSNACAICGRTQEEAGSSRKLHIDHDHKSGQIRALLCCNCNHGLGCFHDDPELMRKAAEYIELHRNPDNA